MKRVFNIICALAVGALALNSCVERPPVDNPGDGPGGNQIEIPVGPEAIMRPDICTPVDCIPCCLYSTRIVKPLCHNKINICSIAYFEHMWYNRDIN